MPYVASDGSVRDSRPFSLSSIVDVFWSIINFFILFFRTLIQPGASSKGDKYESDRRSRFTGGGPGGGPGGGNGPQRRVGRLGGNSGMAAPPMPAGG